MVSRVIDWVQQMSALNRAKDKTSRDSSSSARSVWAVDQMLLEDIARHLMLPLNRCPSGVSGLIRSPESHPDLNRAFDSSLLEVQLPFLDLELPCALSRGVLEDSSDEEDWF
jgi:hypothetical protein